MSDVTRNETRAVMSPVIVRYARVMSNELGDTSRPVASTVLGANVCE